MDCPYADAHARRPGVDTAASAGVAKTRVLETRRSADGSALLRGRRCEVCRQTFNTVEQLDALGTAGGLPVQVRLRDGSLIPFDLLRVRISITEALTTPSGEVVQELVDGIVTKVGENVARRGVGRHAISVDDVGDLVLRELTQHRLVYAVSRIRYALGLRSPSTRPEGFHNVQEVKDWLLKNWPTGEPSPQPLGRRRRVVRKRGNKGDEEWEQEKLAHSIRRAARGRDPKKVEELVSGCLNYVHDELSGQSVVTTEQIATETMKYLHRSEPLAYLRYASAAKRFRTAGEFWAELEDLERARRPFTGAS